MTRRRAVRYWVLDVAVSNGLFSVCQCVAHVRNGVVDPDGFDVYCSGNFGVSGAKLFQIDHPLHPETDAGAGLCAAYATPCERYSKSACDLIA